MKQRAVQSFPIKPKYRKDNGLYLHDIDRDDLPLGFKAVSRCSVTIPPHQFGGNHAHVRKEGFIGIGEGLEIVWLDQDGKRHVAAMNPDGRSLLFVVGSMVPHAIRNNADSLAVILEYADLRQEDSPLQRVEVI